MREKLRCPLRAYSLRPSCDIRVPCAQIIVEERSEIAHGQCGATAWLPDDIVALAQQMAVSSMWVCAAQLQQCRRASWRDAGLSNAVPCKLRTWSAPITKASAIRFATETALASARNAQVPGERPGRGFSARLIHIGRTRLKSRPARSSSRRRIGLVDARITASCHGLLASLRLTAAG